ncbi:MAG: hypothetical protein ACI4QM_01410 [Alphaproteobacteria bacterium]
MTEQKQEKQSLKDTPKEHKETYPHAKKITQNQKKIINDIIEKYDEVLKVLAK